MPSTARPALVAAALLAAAAAPALAHAQGYGSQGYGSQGYNAQSGYGRDARQAPASTYDRSDAAGQPSSGYGRPAPGYGRDGADRYGQADEDDASAGPGQGDDPEALARQLNLSASQRQAYDSYRRAFQPDEARMRQEDEEMRRMAGLTTPQRLDAARAAMERDRADFERTSSATRAFYGQLSPAQRRTFDQATAPRPDEDDGGDEDGPRPSQPTGRPQR